MADAELPRKLDAHISECSKCYAIFDTTRRTLKLYMGMQPQGVPEVVHVRLMAAVERKMAGQKPAPTPKLVAVRVKRQARSGIGRNSEDPEKPMRVAPGRYL